MTNLSYTKQGIISLSALAACMSGTNALAQSIIYPNPTAAGHSYALINTPATALYINDRGDLGAPFLSGSAKPNGKLDTAGKPVVNTDGSVDSTTANPRSYGLLINSSPTPGIGNLRDSIRDKTEYLTVGSPNVAEGFGLIGSNAGLSNGSNRWLSASDFNVNAFTALPSLPNSVGVVSTLFRQTDTTNNANGTQRGLQLTQAVSINPVTNLVSFGVTFTNTDVVALTSLHYARAFNPNEGGSPGTTTQSFGSGNSSQLFLVNSSSGSRQLGLGVRPGDPNTVGARVTATSNSSEGSLLTNPDSFFKTTNSFVTLGTGNTATYNKGSGTSPTTNDFTTDSPFRQNVSFGSSGDYGLILESAMFDLAPGASGNFNFFFSSDATGIGSVPEPGVTGLMAGGLSFGLLLLRRRRR